MEPLLDKLARQKVVKDFFAVIRGYEIRADNWMHSAPVHWRIAIVVLIGGGCVTLPTVIFLGSAALFLPVFVLLFWWNCIIVLPNFCLICCARQRWHYKPLHFGIFLAYVVPMCLTGWDVFSIYFALADLHFLYLLFVGQRLPSGRVWKIAKFTVAFLMMAVICTIVWDSVVMENLYNCTDDNAFGFLRPGDWVGAFGTFPIVQVDHITHVSQSMSDPDTIKKGWTVTDLWLVWLSFVAVSLVVSIGLASLPWTPKRLKSNVPDREPKNDSRGSGSASLCEN